MKILITGAAKRIGRMLAIDLAQQGHKIAIHYNRSDIEAMELLTLLGGPDKGHTLIQADLNQLDETEAILSKLQSWGKPSILINNASTYIRRGLTHFSNEELIDDYNINFFSPLILMREFKNQCGFGTIINILDERVNCIEPEAGPYALAKKSLRDATQACAVEWAPQIKVHAITPGPVLLPEESVEKASHKELLINFKKTVRELIETKETGLIKGLK